MKIVLLNHLYAPNGMGGAERVVQSLAESLVQAGCRVVVVSTAPQKGTKMSYINGVKVYYVGLKNLYWWPRERQHHKALKPLWHALDIYNPWMAREVARVLDTERPDLVHTNCLAGFSALVWQLVKRRGVSLVHTLHDYYLLCPRATMFRSERNCMARCFECRMCSLPRTRSSNQVDAVVGVSRFILERHLKFGSFAATPEKRVIFNASHISAPGLPSDTRPLPVRFGYLGRLHPTKGLEVLLKSVAQLPEGTWSLSVAGQGLTTYERFLRSKYGTAAINFLGHVRPEAFFSDIEVLVVPSLWHDPLPTVIIEALTYGVPVIGSNRGGIPELVEEGRTGFLFNPSRRGDLTEKMQRYIDDPPTLDRMRPACAKRAKDFLPDNVVEQYLQLYANISEAV